MLLLVLIVSLLAGCQREDEIAEYDAPKAPPPPAQVSAMSPQDGAGATSQPTTSPAGNPDSVTGLTWSLPQGWVAQPPQQMRSVWFKSHTDVGDAEIISSKLGGQYGSLRANIDRWRGM